MSDGLLFCYVLAVVTPVVIVVVTGMIIAVIAVPIRSNRERIVTRSGSVSVVVKQWFRPGVTVSTIESICQRTVRSRGPMVLSQVVPAVVSRMIIPLVVYAGCVVIA